MNIGESAPAERIIIALDLPGYDEAAHMVDRLGEDVKFYKVGLELFLRAGERILDLLKEAGKEIFLDLKLHDIPNTVGRAVDAIAARDVSLTTLHTMGGFEMMSAAAASAGPVPGRRPGLLGVTVLTSVDEDTLRDDLQIQESIPKMVRGLATVAQRAGLDGVVASALELSLLREHFPDDFLVVTPGIRPRWAAKDDQKRVVTPRDAFREGASYIVIGRPVTGAGDPAGAFRKIVDEVET